MIIQLNDIVSIIHTLSNHSVTIQFKYASPTLIKSIVKPRIICDATMDDTFTNIQFTATKVCTLTQYIKSIDHMRILDALTLFKNLFEQLYYLNTYEHQTFIGYRPEEILVIDNNTFIFLGCDFISDISTEGNELCLISCPFLKTNGLFSLEMLNITVLPTYIHYRTSHYSLALIYLYAIHGENKFGKYDKSHQNVMKLLNHPVIIETPIYWLLKKCLYENPTERIVLIN